MPLLQPPDGFEEIELVVDDLNRKMREAEKAPHEGKRKGETLWPIFRINHQRSRVIYEALKDKKIDKKVYDYCVKKQWVDTVLVNKWKKSGFDRLCCVQCASAKSHNFNTACICRVPKRDLDDNDIKCRTCGCSGCASGD